MWARVATFEGVDVERVRAEANRPPDRMPEGMRGAFGLIDAERSQQLFITLFDTREAIEAAEPTFEQMGDEIPEAVRGRAGLQELLRARARGHPAQLTAPPREEVMRAAWPRSRTPVTWPDVTAGPEIRRAGCALVHSVG